MRLGFAAMKRQDYYGATHYFREALVYVADDREATLAYWNARKALHDSTPIPDQSPRESDYDRFMRLGYDEVHKRDYQAALINFNRALEQRPGDYYATLALRNVKAYIAAQKGEPISNIDEISLNVADSPYAGESAYDRYMRLGYAAAKEQKWAIASDYFHSALYERPNDRLATIAFWNVNSHINSTGGSSETIKAIETYDRYMRLGYDAVQRHHFQDALNYFQGALKIKPADQYATQAVRNVQTYMRKTSNN
jgi:uncharacterized protein HemY